MEQREFNPGDLILQEDDKSDVVYEIISGEVEIFTEMDSQTVILGTVKTGEFLGEMGIIEHRPRSASARAKTEVMAMILQKWEFMRLMSENPSSAYRLIHRLSERLVAMNSKLAEVTLSQKKLEEASHKSEWPFLAGQAEAKQKAEPLRVTLLPASKYVTSHVPKEGVVIQTFPYSVGRQIKSNEPRPSVPITLALPDKNPYRLSRQHFSVSHDSNGYGVYDLGSTLGTEVNGEFLGQHFGKDHKSLKLGENIITAGGMDSPFIFKVLLEKD
jgi:hypothetical protein